LRGKTLVLLGGDKAKEAKRLLKPPEARRPFEKGARAGLKTRSELFSLAGPSFPSTAGLLLRAS
jgi:hypothetical protein